MIRRNKARTILNAVGKFRSRQSGAHWQRGAKTGSGLGATPSALSVTPGSDMLANRVSATAAAPGLALSGGAQVAVIGSGGLNSVMLGNLKGGQILAR